ncbi:MAG: HesA/MoeB/ThiF family protein [Myxococcales bacterium]|nr:HesA/MoeB/ThiF family protein [Myxococcales bacterium]
MTRLADARVLVVGVGGLGCPAALALALAGVGTLGLVDDDRVDASNLHRQILFGEADVGEPKVSVAAKALVARAPSLRVEPHDARLTPRNARELVRGYDLAIDGSDNFATKFLLADACALERRPVVHGAAIRWHGTALAVSAEGAPCYRCLFEDLPEGEAATCDSAGVVGPVVGVVAAAQADLAISLLTDLVVAGELVTFDGLAMTARRRTVRPRRGCALCSEDRSIASLTTSRYVAQAACEA